MLSTKDRAENCKDQIRAFLASNFYIADADSLESNTSLLDQGIVDSTGVLEVIGFIE
ncbi:MAG: acyl carrier protein, partial [Mesorhizobium sp.]